MDAVWMPKCVYLFVLWREEWHEGVKPENAQVGDPCAPLSVERSVHAELHMLTMSSQSAFHFTAF